MDVTNSAAANFVARLREERMALLSFVNVLEKEQQALLDLDSELLLTLVEIKTQSANQLAALVQTRRQLLDANAADTAAWLQKNSPDASLIWEEILGLTQRAQHLNQVNGEVIQLKLRSNHLALNALLGAAKNVNSGLYGRDGQPSLAIAGRSLGSG